MFGPTLFNPEGKGGTGQEVRGKVDEVEADAHGQAEVGVGRWSGAYSRWRQVGMGGKAGVGKCVWGTAGRGVGGQVA